MYAIVNICKNIAKIPIQRLFLNKLFLITAIDPDNFLQEWDF